MVHSRFISLKVSCAAILLSLSWSAHGASLGLTLADAPDIVSGFISVKYDAAADSLSASGFAFGLTTDSGFERISGGLYLLDANIDGAGNLVGGTIEIQGTVASLGYNSGTLLTGVFTDFGFAPDGDPLEFLFEVTGGDAAPLYGGLGGVILGFSGFSGNFHDNFSNGGNGVSDVAAIPVPAAIWLMLTALAGLAGMRKTR